MSCPFLEYRRGSSDRQFDGARAYCAVAERFVQPMRADICNDRYDLDHAADCEIYREHVADSGDSDVDSEATDSEAASADADVSSSDADVGAVDADAGAADDAEADDGGRADDAEVDDS